MLSYFWLKKGLSSLDIGVLLVSFGGVVLLITGSLQQDGGSQNINMDQSSIILALITLPMFPILSAVITIMTRQLRDVHEFSVSSYIAFAMVFIYGFTSLFSGDNTWELVRNFEPIDYLILIGLGISSSSLYLCISKAV